MKLTNKTKKREAELVREAMARVAIHKLTNGETK